MKIFNQEKTRKMDRPRHPREPFQSKSDYSLLPSPSSLLAFTLLEVLIAMFIFFLCIFSILQLTTRSLQSARAIQQGEPNAGMLAAYISSYTNRLEEGSDSGDFGDAYPSYRWEREVSLASTNGFFRVDFRITKLHQRISSEPELSIYLYRPDSIVKFK